MKNWSLFKLNKSVVLLIVALMFLMVLSAYAYFEVFTAACPVCDKKIYLLSASHKSKIFNLPTEKGEGRVSSSVEYFVHKNKNCANGELLLKYIQKPSATFIK